MRNAVRRLSANSPSCERPPLHSERLAAFKAIRAPTASHSLLHCPALPCLYDGSRQPRDAEVVILGWMPDWMASPLPLTAGIEATHRHAKLRSQVMQNATFAYSPKVPSPPLGSSRVPESVAHPLQAATEETSHAYACHRYDLQTLPDRTIRTGVASTVLPSWGRDRYRTVGYASYTVIDHPKARELYSPHGAGCPSRPL